MINHPNFKIYLNIEREADLIKKLENGFSKERKTNCAIEVKDTIIEIAKNPYFDLKSPDKEDRYKFMITNCLMTDKNSESDQILLLGTIEKILTQMKVKYLTVRYF